MSTTVTYKGSTLTTVNNNTKTLKTAGKYMEGDVVLSDESVDVSQDTVTADKLMQGYTAHDRTGTLIIGTASSASEASNVVVGSFTAGTAETVQTINVPYTGNGYIVSLTISVDGGIRGKYFYQINHQYACAIFCGVKYYASQAPDYTANNANINGMTILVTYKGSGNTTVSSGGTGSNGTTMAYTSNDPSALSSASIVQIASKNSVKIFVSASTSGQGFLSGAVYNYVAVYSE